MSDEDKKIVLGIIAVVVVWYLIKQTHQKSAADRAVDKAADAVNIMNDEDASLFDIEAALIEADTAAAAAELADDVAANAAKHHVADKIKPRQANIKDMGINWMPHGWYDQQNQGAKNDYCRYVNGPKGHPVFACALAGSSDQVTVNAAFDDDEYSASMF